VEIRDCSFAPSALEEKTYPVSGSKLTFQQIVNSGETDIPIQWYSKSLFETVHPEVKVTYVAGNVWDTKSIMTGLAGGTAPMVYSDWGTGYVMNHPYSIHLAAKNGLWADLSEFEEDFKEEISYFKDLFPAFWVEGKWYAVPRADNRLLQASAIEYRKSWFKEAGIFNEKGEPAPPENWTWNDFREIAKKLTNAKKKHWGISLMWNAGPCMWGIYDFGCLSTDLAYRVIDKSGKNTWRFGVTPALLRFWNFMKDLRWKDKSALGGVEYTGWSQGVEDMHSGRTGMCWSNIIGGIYNNVGVYTYSPTIPNTEEIGLVPDPIGKYGLAENYIVAEGFGFDPTLNKKQLKAALEWYFWNAVGRGQQLRIEHELDLLHTFGEKGLSASLACDALLNVFPWKGVIAKERSKIKELLPPQYVKTCEKATQWTPLASNFVSLGRYGLVDPSKDKGAIKVAEAIFNTIMGDPNADIEEVIKKNAEIANSTEYNYKVKDQEEKMEKYLTALGEYYKKYYPEFYKSKEYEEQYEEQMGYYRMSK